MTNTTIPPEALEAAAKAAYEADWYDTNEKWENALPDVKDVYHTIAYAACQTMLKAWPGMSDIPAGEFDGEQYPRIIHLPLTENTNAQV